jgi:hypothetical protein
MSQVDFNNNLEIQPEMPVITSQNLIAKIPELMAQKKKRLKNIKLSTKKTNTLI